MVDYIGDELPPKVIRVTKGADRKFSIRRLDADENPVNWDAEVYLNIDINKTTVQRVDAEVTNESAVVRIESTIADLCKETTTWQAIMSIAQPDPTPSLEIPLMVGVFDRQDGDIDDDL